MIIEGLLNEPVFKKDTARRICSLPSIFASFCARFLVAKVRLASFFAFSLSMK
jgi:hypothetical protein